MCIGLLLAGIAAVKGCGRQTRAAGQGELIRDVLTEAPDERTDHEFDFELYTLAIATPGHALQHLADDVVDSVHRHGAFRMPSFLVHWVERVAHARANGSREALDRVLSAIRGQLPFPPLGGPPHRVGAIEYSTPARTRVFSRDLASLFFCVADSDQGRAILETGYPASRLMHIAAVVGEIEESGRRSVHEDPALDRIAREAASFFDSCGQDGEDGRGGALDGIGLDDSFASCLLGEADATNAKAMKLVETLVQCMKHAEDSEGSPGEGLMTGEDEESRIISEANDEGVKAETPWWVEYEEEAVQKDDGVAAAKADLLDAEENKDAAEEAHEEGRISDETLAELEADYAEAEAAYKTEIAEFIIAQGVDPTADPNEATGQSDTLPAPWKNAPDLVDGGVTPTDCWSESMSNVPDWFADLIEIEPPTPGVDPLISYFIEDPVHDWFLTGCGAALLSMSDDQSTWSGQGACALAQPPCNQEQRAEELAAQIAAIQSGGIAGTSCSEAYSDEGFTCQSGVVAPVGGLDVLPSDLPLPDSGTAHPEGAVADVSLVHRMLDALR